MVQISKDCLNEMIIISLQEVIKRPLKETRFSLYGLGGLQSLLPINNPDIIAHIKGLSYLSDYMVIRATLGGAF